ncbi:hypothetical protein RF11_16179 [Thelohanellus kitauei]|uniref:Tc1-like transposase DDE domain-containing protein n=1 Tax=Thelohanellus kitauei TaxID=669202 RepID=A0A0C2J9R8_THEKT|nr:hypothetical protein RF11_16179 [Thelohanellus kitauei]
MEYLSVGLEYLSLKMEHIIKAISHNNSLTAVSRTFDVDLSTIHSIWKEYQLSGKIAQAPKGGNRAKSLNSSKENILCDSVEDDCSLILEKSSDRFFNATNIRIKCNDLFKKIKFIPERRNIASTIQERDDYVIKYLEYSTSNRFILFIDETWFNISMRRNYGRATGGNPTEKIKKYQISEHNSLLGHIQNFGYVLKGFIKGV